MRVIAAKLRPKTALKAALAANFTADDCLSEKIVDAKYVALEEAQAHI